MALCEAQIFKDDAVNGVDKRVAGTLESLVYRAHTTRADAALHRILDALTPHNHVVFQ